MSRSYVGKTSVGKSPSMVLNLGCVVPHECIDLDENQPPPDDNGGILAMCNGYLSGGQPPPSERVCVQTIALHEFGHAIGLRHEMAHPDSTCNWNEGLNGTDQFGIFHDGEPVGGFDPDSIMSYCKAIPLMHGTVTPAISDGDLARLSMLYPSPPMLFGQPNLAGNPALRGPGFFNTGLPTIRSVSAPPGYNVTLCSAGGCSTVTGIVKTLPSWLDGQVTSVRVTTAAAGYIDPGYQHSTAYYPPGKYLAINNTLKLPNDQLSSMWLPHGLAATLCRHEGSSPYNGLECAPQMLGSPAQDDVPAVTLSSFIDNQTSFIRISSFAQLYGNYNFRGSDRGSFFPGTYRTSGGHDFSGVKSWLVPQDLELTVCTGEGDGTGTGCTVVKSGDATVVGIKLIKVQVLPTSLPPCTTC